MKFRGPEALKGLNREHPTITTGLSDNALYIKVKRMGLSLGSVKASK